MAQAGGWKDPDTLTIYEQPNRDSVRDVVLNPRRELREAEGWPIRWAGVLTQYRPDGDDTVETKKSNRNSVRSGRGLRP